MKRTASKAAGAARKMAKTITKIEPTIKAAESLPEPVRSIIANRLVHVFGTYKEDRHAFQKTCSDLVASTLKATQGGLQAAINEAQGKKGAEEAQGGSLAATHNAADAASGAAAQAAADSKAALDDSHKGAKDAKAALHDLEAAQKQGETDAANTGAKKEKLEALIKEFFTPVKEGTLDKGLKGSASYAGKHLKKDFSGTLESEFLACVIRTFSKAAASWGTFDHIVDKELDQSLKTISASLTAELGALAAAKDTRAANIEGAKAAVTAADEHAKAADEANNGATAAAKEAKKAAKATDASVKQQQKVIDKAAGHLKDAEDAMTTFQEGPLAAYTEAEAFTAPPPEPEPVEPESAPLVDQAMTAAPPRAVQQAMTASRPAMSPGVLMQRAASSMAAAVGLAPSPRVASSPRQPSQTF